MNEDIAQSTSGSSQDESGQVTPPAMPVLQVSEHLVDVESQVFINAKDTEHIKVLSICYYVNAGLMALATCIPIIYFLVGVGLISGVFEEVGNSGHDREVMQMFGGMMIVMSGLFFITGCVATVLNFLVARRMVMRESRILCLIVAGVNCLSVPLGLVLGVFTFIVLSRPQVVESFEKRAVAE